MNEVIPLKRYVVPWSGGVDSTMALYIYLKRSNPDTVRTISFDVSQIPYRQRKHEYRARKKIAKWFDKEFGYRFEQQSLEIKSHGNVFRGLVPQPIIWIALTAGVVEVGEKVVFSWLKTDYDPKMMCQIIEAWRNLAMVNGADPEIEMPFIGMSKARIQQDAAELGVLEHCWYCEGSEKGPVGKVCGKCECCMSFKAGEMERKMRWKPLPKLTAPKRKK